MASSLTSQPDASRAPLLQLRDVSKRYAGKIAIDVDSLDVADGDAINLIGANGSGKSTLLRIMAGVTRPSRGRVRRSDQARGLRIVLVPQGGGLYPSLTVAENIDAVSRLFGGRGTYDDRAIPYLYELGLNEFVDRRVGELSGGYRRLASIASALAVSPDGLLLDEPFSALDTQKAGMLREFLAQARSRLRFLVVSGHDVDDFVGGFGRSVRCVDGKVVAGID